MTLQDIQAFVAVVDSGSVVGASSRLHLSQPAVTRRLQALEESLGETLLDRSSKPQLPTPAGKKAYGLARRVLSSVEDLRHSFGENVDTGEFKFGATPRITDLGLIDAVTALRGAYPKLTLRASSGWSASLIEQVQAGTLDAAALSTVDTLDRHSGLEVKPIGTLSGCVIVAKDDPTPTRVTLAHLAERSWVLNNDGCSMRGLVESALRAKGLPFNVAVEAFSLDLQIGLVAKGTGVGLVTEEMLGRSAHRSGVRALVVRDFRPTLTACVVHRPLPERLQGVLSVLALSLERSLAPVR